MLAAGSGEKRPVIPLGLSYSDLLHEPANLRVALVLAPQAGHLLLLRAHDGRELLDRGLRASQRALDVAASRRARPAPPAAAARGARSAPRWRATR